MVLTTLFLLLGLTTLVSSGKICQTWNESNL